jgi:hypothetical protein
LFSRAAIIRIIKTRKINWVAQGGDEKNVRILIGTPEETKKSHVTDSNLHARTTSTLVSKEVVLRA